ncbi:plastocyanin/azurin family copper-binding protein [Natrinema sp. 1APR25-10V2]|uniref:cupredoxin domain-containing protein n=1 Tax=Natrinema sp. 1APR25-10V2 TaxID=2951081 RepID=UPI00287689F5|nr:plastocyanin/azurin family copper-binding protein [Natrinema sp. 1APR25-10V2]MDS0477186.1 plastocyanin/azurin family copper-binding protein [Natrinema sp. 1APR25-10V2]
MLQEIHDGEPRRTGSTTDCEDTDRSERQSNAIPSVGRRPLLKALGVGAPLSVGGGVVAASQNDPQTPRIDSHYGYATPSAKDIPDKLEPDHTVELRVSDPAPGEHGPLFHFEPTGLTVDAGDIVQFRFTTPDHTVTAYHPAHGYQRRIPADAPQFSSPVVGAGGTWLYQFEEEGLYDVFCAPHHIFGMNMRLVVGNLDEDDVPDYEDTFEGAEGPPPLLAPFSKQFLEGELNRFSGPNANDNAEWVWLTPREVLDTDVLDPNSIQAGDGTVSFDDVLADIERVSGGHSHD